jgi:GNAT superfamily N-acetyltransferase
VSPSLVLSHSDEPNSANITFEGLRAYNKSNIGYTDTTPLNILLQNESGETIGGLNGKTTFGVLFIDVLYVPEDLRGQRLGQRMMDMAEEEARRRGCIAGFVYTLNFQAPEFYQHLGWEPFGEIACAPEGINRVFLKKKFH